MFIAAAAWLTSLALPALSFHFDREVERILNGYQVLIGGWFHLLVLEFSWLANIVFWFVVWHLMRTRKQPRTLRVSGIVLCLLTMQSAEIFLFPHFFQEPKPYPGYFFWVSANVLLGAVAIFGSRHANGSWQST